MDAGEVAKKIIKGIGIGVIEIGKAFMGEMAKAKKAKLECEDLSDSDLRRKIETSSGTEKTVATSILNKRLEDRNS